MKAITILLTALAFAALVGCGNQEKETKTNETTSYERTVETTETRTPKEDRGGFGWFRKTETEETATVEPERSWRWFGWFRGDEETEEVIVEAPAEEKGWFTRR